MVKISHSLAKRVRGLSLDSTGIPHCCACYMHNICLSDVSAYPLLAWIEQPKRNSKQQENTVRHSDGLLCDSALRAIPIGD